MRSTHSCERASAWRRIGGSGTLTPSLGEPAAPGAGVHLEPVLEVDDRAGVEDRLDLGVPVLGAPLGGLEGAPQRDRLRQRVAALDVDPGERSELLLRLAV